MGKARSEELVTLGEAKKPVLRQKLDEVSGRLADASIAASQAKDALTLAQQQAEAAVAEWKARQAELDAVRAEIAKVETAIDDAGDALRLWGAAALLAQIGRPAKTAEAQQDEAEAQGLEDAAAAVLDPPTPQSTPAADPVGLVPTPPGPPPPPDPVQPGGELPAGVTLESPAGVTLGSEAPAGDTMPVPPAG